MPVAELMEDAAMLIKDAMVGVDQTEEGIAGDEAFTMLRGQFRVLIGQK